ncbi:hypothetical protein ACFVIM_28340 [Streptomyces sp. NPDC057638]|uniref:hypothetical protein n=1 Tax=Streptomyces sp. NPDC057638 TaxID=3346190 RepID=UPI0036CAB352
MAELTVFGALLRKQGRSYARFTREYVAAAGALGLDAVPPQRRQFDRWRIVGRVKTMPRDDARQVLEHLFPGYTAQVLLVPADSPQAALCEGRGDSHGPEATEEEDVNRRNALALIGVGAGLLAPAALEFMEASRKRMDEALEASPIGALTLERWEAAAQDYARAYQSLPPQALLADLLGDIAEVRGLLEERQPIRHRRRLCRITAQLSALAGIFTSALGAHREARGWFHTGRLAAAEAGDTHLEGTLAVRSAIVSLYYGTPSAARAEATRARHHIGSIVGPASVRALVVEARALARMGRGTEALPLLRRAEEMFGQLSEDDRNDIALGYTERQFLFHVGNAWTHLGRVEEAWKVQRRALDAYAPTEYLDPTLIRLDRATALVRGGEVEEAYRTASGALQALPREHRTGMVVRYAENFGALASRHRLPAGRAFAELLRS